MTRRKRSSAPIFRLQITLYDSKPPIWRIVELPGDWTLGDLHAVIQIAMGWQFSHMHQFMIGDQIYAEPYPGFFDDVQDENEVQLQAVAGNVGDFFGYEYDFGDSWTHVIEVKAIGEAEKGVRYPRCVDGARACPPEDVGGVWGYQDFLEALQDPDHPEHEEYVDWVDEDFDPEHFSCEAVNKQFAKWR